MKRTKEMQLGGMLLRSAVTVALVLMAAMFMRGFSIVSHAESAAKVTATSANIRKTPDASSETIGSTEKDKVISIKSQVQGSDGYTWYEVYKDANTLGYIRADLVEITDGTTPPTGTVPTTTATTTTPAPTTSTPIPDEPLVDVTAVNPAEAKVQGGDTVRIRQNASTTSRIVTTVKNGMALTITGTAAGKDGKTWYQVTFLSGGSEMSGFIRSDYTNVNPDTLTPYTEEIPTEDPGVDEPPEDVEPVVEKAYDTMIQDGMWILVDNEAGQGYEIQELFNGVTQNAELYLNSEKTVKTQKAVIIILVILLVGAAAAITLLIFKIKDVSDAQYFNEVERETINRRSTRPQGGGQRMMSSAGGDRQGGRPVGSSQGQRPQGGRPAGASQGQRPQGSRPAGASQGGRPVGSSQGQPRQVSQGQRPAASSQGQPRQATQGQRPVQQPKSSHGQQGPGWHSKNFMADDDEFEFEFLNYEGDDAK